MGLVANAAQQPQTLGVVGQHDRRRAAGDEELLLALGDRDSTGPGVDQRARRRRARRSAGPCRRRSGSDRAGDANDSSRSESWGETSAPSTQRAVRRASVERIASKSSAPRRGAIAPANPEAPVVRLLRSAALEDHHRRHGVLGADVRDVEALDPHRQLVEAERLGKLGERVDPLAPGPFALQVLLGQGELGVALGELAQAALLAAPAIRGPRRSHRAAR